nr:CrcB family protein [Cellulomonas marina]
MLALAVAVAGGLGAATRLVVDGAVRERLRTAAPSGTHAVNLTGSLLLGLLTGLVLRGWPGVWALVLGTGFLGGYTTYGTAAVETARLLAERRWWAAMVHGPGMLVAAVLLAALGLVLGAGPALG